MAYATLEELRALDGLADADVFSDDDLQAAIKYATETIDAYCLGGGSFEPKAFRVRVWADGWEPLFLRVIGPRTVTKVTDRDGREMTGWTLDVDFGEVTPDVYAYGPYVIEGLASATEEVPEGIRWACRTIARQWLLDLHSRVPDRALSIQSDYGQVQLAQAGGQPDRPTSLPDVNAVLNRNRHRPPAIG